MFVVYVISEEKQYAVMVNSVCKALGINPDREANKTDDIVLEFD